MAVHPFVSPTTFFPHLAQIPENQEENGMKQFMFKPLMQMLTFWQFLMKRNTKMNKNWSKRRGINVNFFFFFMV